MGSKAESYRKRVEAADEMAKSATDDNDRSRWSNLARHWRDLARHAEANRWGETIPWSD
jgi:hypothetical protein